MWILFIGSSYGRHCASFKQWLWIHFVRIDNGTDLCFWLARDAREFSESRPVFPSTNNLESFHYLYTHDTQALALGR